MTDEKAQTQEFKLDPDCELRFEVESKNEKVTLEVFITSFSLLLRFIITSINFVCLLFISIFNLANRTNQQIILIFSGF